MEGPSYTRGFLTWIKKAAGCQGDGVSPQGSALLPSCWGISEALNCFPLSTALASMTYFSSQRLASSAKKCSELLHSVGRSWGSRRRAGADRLGIGSGQASSLPGAADPQGIRRPPRVVAARRPGPSTPAPAAGRWRVPGRRCSPCRAPAGPRLHPWDHPRPGRTQSFAVHRR